MIYRLCIYWDRFEERRWAFYGSYIDDIDTNHNQNNMKHYIDWKPQTWVEAVYDRFASKTLNSNKITLENLELWSSTSIPLVPHPGNLKTRRTQKNKNVSFIKNPDSFLFLPFCAAPLYCDECAGTGSPICSVRFRMQEVWRGGMPPLLKNQPRNKHQA